MKTTNDEMRPEYDFTGGVRGKYVNRLARTANVVVLDDDVATVFPDSASVNDALRALTVLVQSQPGLKRRSGARGPKHRAA